MFDIRYVKQRKWMDKFKVHGRNLIVHITPHSDVSSLLLKLTKHQSNFFYIHKRVKRWVTDIPKKKKKRGKEKQKG